MACYKLTFKGSAEEIRIPASSDTFNLKDFLKDLLKFSSKEAALLTRKSSFEKPIIESTKQTKSLSDHVYYSGNAKGADLMWFAEAAKYSPKSLMFFDVNFYEKLSEGEKELLNAEYEQVCEILGHLQPFSKDTYQGKLVRRDMLQADKADAIFAIGNLSTDDRFMTGGSKYAVTRGIILGKPVYVYDIDHTHAWLKWNSAQHKFIRTANIPKITPNAALIGTRQLDPSHEKNTPAITEEGRRVIEEFFKSALDNPTTFEPRTELRLTSPNKTALLAEEIGGIDTLRHPNSDGMHFGNPFSFSAQEVASNKAKILTPDVKTAVELFEAWLREEPVYVETINGVSKLTTNPLVEGNVVPIGTIEPERRNWIRQQLFSGTLNNKPFVYYTDKIPDASYGTQTYNYFSAPNHAHILLKLLNEFISNLESELNINNSDQIENDPTNFNTASDSLKILNSADTILSNEELLAMRGYTGSENPRIAVASEHTDPAFASKTILNMLSGKKAIVDKLGRTIDPKDIDGLYIITKHDGLPIQKLLQYPIPKIIHFSITGLGGTKYEPGVMKPDDLLDRIELFIKMGLDPDMITIRIDPIIPGVSDFTVIERIIKRGSEMGITHFRYSIMDLYKTTKQYMSALGYDYRSYYDEGSLHARPDIQLSIGNQMLGIAKKFGVLLSTCAEQVIPEGVLREGCLSVLAVSNMLGVHVNPSYSHQRTLCSCFGGKTDLLAYNKLCASVCSYCYAHHNSDTYLQYYNKDGSLKNINFTRTGLSSKKESKYFYKSEHRLRTTILNGLEEKVSFKFNLDEEFPFDSYEEFSLAIHSYIDKINKLINKARQTKTLSKSDLSTIIDPDYYTISDNTIDEFLYLMREEGNDWSDVFFSIYLGFVESMRPTIDVLNVLLDESSLGLIDLIDHIDDEDFYNTYFEFSYSDPQQTELEFTDLPQIMEFTPENIPQLEGWVGTTTTLPDTNSSIQMEVVRSKPTIDKINSILNELTQPQHTDKPLIKDLDVFEALNVIADRFKKLGIDVVILDSDADMEKQGLPKNTEAAVVEGKIIINKSRASASSPMHEFMHLVFAIMKQQNFKTFANLMLQLRGIKAFESILTELNTSDSYSNLIESDLMEEAFVRYLSGIIEETIELDDQFALFLLNNQSTLNEFIQKTFNVDPIVDLVSFLKSPFSQLTLRGSDLFVLRDINTSGYSDKKYLVDISGKIMSFIQEHMHDLIEKGDCV